MVKNYNWDEIPSIYDLNEIPEFEGDGIYRKAFRGLDKLLQIVSLTPEFKEEYHSHPWEQINFVVEGEAEFFMNDTKLNISSGNIFLVPPGVRHRVETAEHCKMFIVHPLRENRTEHTEYQAEFT